MKRGEAGSVLIEAMVAAAIVALMLGAMYRSIADDARGERVLVQKRAALLIAQSELDAAGTVTPLAAGAIAGVEDNYVWRMDMEPYASAQGSAGKLWQVTVTVRPRDGSVSLVTLRTLALGPRS